MTNITLKEISLQLEKIQSEIFIIDSLTFTVYVALTTDLYPSSEFAGALAGLNNRTTYLSEEITQIIDNLITYRKKQNANQDNVL